MASAEILPTHTPELFDRAVARAAELLRAGELVALPTETVYGLAANAFDSAAAQRIFTCKGRPAHNPIIVHVADLAMARSCAAAWPEMARQFANAFWPGPLTLVVPRSERVPDVVTAGGETVGVRWPAHPFMQAVIRACGFPLAAPSANRSNEISPTNARHVAQGLGDRIPLIVDGGQSQVGIESTVIDVTGRVPRVLRPGMIHDESLRAVTGELAVGTDTEGALRSPGMLRRHYAPKARLLMAGWRDEAEFDRVLRQLEMREGLRRARAHVVAHTHIPLGASVAGVSVIPHDAEAFARAIYDELHRCDAAGAEWIVVEQVPAAAEWRAIADRLARAATV
jgi:L-threonylcarbamoyladenylate synthase